MHDSDHFFIDLSPPPGGLQRLQRRLAGSDHATGWRRRLWLPIGAAFATSLLVLATLLPGVVARQQQTNRLISALHESIAPPAHGLRVVDGAAIELPSGNADVRLYLVQSTAPVTHAGPD
jgi:hypothetical protein